MMPVKKITPVLIVLVLFAVSLSGCHSTPDEVQVRRAISAMATAAEAGSAMDLVAPLGDDFDGNGGELDRRSLGNMVRLLSLRGEHVGVIMGRVTIERRGERILASFTVTLSRGSALLPDQLGVYEVESAWRKDGGHWRCYTASWKHRI